MRCEKGGAVVLEDVLWKSWVCVCDDGRGCEYKNMRSYVNEKSLEIGYDGTRCVNRNHCHH